MFNISIRKNKDMKYKMCSSLPKYHSYIYLYLIRIYSNNMYVIFETM